MPRSFSRENGAALVLALAAVSLLSAVTVAVVVTTTSEARIAGAFRDQRAGTYAADAVIARGLDDLASVADWSAPGAGFVSATLVDGPPIGARTLTDGSTIDLQQVVNMANCQKPAACTVAELDTVTERRPWGGRNPRWTPFAYCPLRDLLPPDAVDPSWYVVLLVADDPLRADNVIALRAEAFGPRNAHAVVEVLAVRTTGADSDYNGESPVSVNMLSWREVR
jgi:hypothetical protein